MVDPAVARAEASAALRLMGVVVQGGYRLRNTIGKEQSP